ncbi:hypothetical protein F0T03_00585 [Yersinia canariae]|uniref:Uncharacterized protein n=1 Tax=Yersinia canariae TaxID=2607663 RepID=A0A857EVQ6_9GAMM|nr:hypothetical protein [Yersinia canariae]QHB30852.1 hypothetical protein F0T03_00585 [Yersinia canariae]
MSIQRSTQSASPKVHFSDIKAVKSSLKELTSTKLSGGPLMSGKLADIKNSCENLQTRLDSQHTKATDDKKLKVGELLKQVTNLINKNAPRTEESNNLTEKKTNHFKEKDLKNSYIRMSQGLDFSSNTKSHRQDVAL